MPTSLLPFLLGMFLGAAALWLYARTLKKQLAEALHLKDEQEQRLRSFSSELATLDTQKQHLSNTLQQLQDQHQRLLPEYEKAREQALKLDAQRQFLEEKLQTQQQELERMGQQMESRFRMLASSVLDEKARSFNEQQHSSLNALLSPLKDHLQQFRQEIQHRYTEETRERASLKTEIKQIFELNRQLSRDAENLTNALKGNTKQQGDWGETILESILDHVGLRKGIHYTLQETGLNEEGKRIRPDVVVNYPDQRFLVIDSKVSLVHYERFCTESDTALQEQQKNLMLASVRNHIDELSRKRYHDRPGALDCVMMFVPVEGAFITVLQAMPDLWQYAYDRKIILLSPTLLLSSMKLVNDFWKRDDETRNARDIARKAAAMYEKLAGLVESMQETGRHLDKATASWNDAFRKLHTGKGNLIGQAEQMKRLNIGTRKSLPDDLIREAGFEDENDEKQS